MNAVERGAGFFRSSLAERLPLWVRCAVITHSRSNLPWVRTGLAPAFPPSPTGGCESWLGEAVSHARELPPSKGLQGAQ